MTKVQAAILFIFIAFSNDLTIEDVIEGSLDNVE
jgi:hypothetical protein